MEDTTSSSPSASWAYQSQSVPGVLPGWDPTPCHPHRMSRHLCRKTEKRETYNGLWSEIHSCMKKVLRTGSFDKLSRWRFCPFSAEYHNRQNIEIPSKHVTRQLCHPSRYRSTLMPGVRKVGYCAIYHPLEHMILCEHIPTQKIRWQPG